MTDVKIGDRFQNRNGHILEVLDVGTIYAVVRPHNGDWKGEIVHRNLVNLLNLPRVWTKCVLHITEENREFTEKWTRAEAEKFWRKKGFDLASLSANHLGAVVVGHWNDTLRPGDKPRTFYKAVAT